MVLVGKGREEAVKELLGLGADPTMKDSNGKTALDWADLLNAGEEIREAVQAGIQVCIQESILEFAPLSTEGAWTYSNVTIGVCMSDSNELSSACAVSSHFICKAGAAAPAYLNSVDISSCCRV